MADWRQDRREERRRQIRRRRLLAAGALVAVAAAIVVVLAAASSGHDGRGSHLSRSAAQKSTARSQPGRSGSGKVPNATPQPGWRPHPGPVPILEYHVLGKAPPEAPYPELYVSRPDFRRQMNWLDRNGFEAVTLAQVEEAWYRSGTLPPKPIVISFDDGYRPQFTFALPQLRRHGWAGVLNLKAEGSDLYRSNVEAMIGAGWELASHSIHHSDLTTIDAARLREEVAASRRLLQREYGVPVKNFCYPSGRFDQTVIAALKAAGYVGATTEIPGDASREKPYELARFEVLGSAGVSGVAADLR